MRRFTGFPRPWSFRYIVPSLSESVSDETSKDGRAGVDSTEAVVGVSVSGEFAGRGGSGRFWMEMGTSRLGGFCSPFLRSRGRDGSVEAGREPSAGRISSSESQEEEAVEDELTESSSSSSRSARSGGFWDCEIGDG